MKTIAFNLVAVFMLSITVLSAAENTKKIKVKGGDCKECKIHIETTTKAVQGVTSAEWNIETKEMTVVFDDETVTLGDIEKAIARSGYDTPNNKAADDAYNALPKCFQYKRDK